ncbi:MAG: lysophospholipid acyltransferase family protein [Deltaproteobacteria bacterium]|nr:lysophospholipid acyltransferase family protein [Deltaproteobacteria bacterium]
MRISTWIPRRTQYRIELVLLAMLMLFCRWMPNRWVLKAGESIGRLAIRLNMRTGTTATNLSLAFPGRFTPEEISALTARCYRHFGREALRIFSLGPLAKQPLEDWLTVEGLEHLTGRPTPGAVLVIGHLGAWELMYLALSRLGVPVTIYSGQHTNKTADRWLNRMRENMGTRTIGAEDDMEDLIAAAKTGVVGLAGDQKPHKAPIYVSFFGRRSAAAQGPAAIAQLAGASMVYGSLVWEANGKARMAFRPVPPSAAPTRRERIQELIQSFFRLLEEDITRHPGQYMWMHKRWKDDPAVQYADTDVLVGKK